MYQTCHISPETLHQKIKEKSRHSYNQYKESKCVNEQEVSMKGLSCSPISYSNMYGPVH